MKTTENIQSLQLKNLDFGEVREDFFSFFKAPISNIKPHKSVNLIQVYNAIKGNFYKECTEKLRSILSLPPSPPLEGTEGRLDGRLRLARQFKAKNFDYCTFSGVFTARNDKALVKHSGLLCIDFDHIDSLEILRSQLLQDDYFDTQLLFVSPSGNGLKWIISINPPLNDLGVAGYFTQSDYFSAVANYILHTYGVAIDKSGKDLSRACFLPYDPQVFINPKIVNRKL